MVTATTPAASFQASDRFLRPGQPSGLITWIAATRIKNSAIILVKDGSGQASFGDA